MPSPKTAILLSNKFNLFISALMFDTDGFSAVNDSVFKFDLSRILRSDVALAIETSLDASKNGLNRKAIEHLNNRISSILEVSCLADIYTMLDIIEIILMDTGDLKVSPFRRYSYGGVERDTDAERVFARDELSNIVQFVIDYFSDASRFLPLARPREPRPVPVKSSSIPLRVGVRVRDSFGNSGKIAYVNENENGGLGLVVVHLDDGRIVRTSTVAHGLIIE